MQTGESTFSSPLLSVHTYTTSVDRRQLGVTLDGRTASNHDYNNPAGSYASNQQTAAENENVTFIPVEDILKIDYSCDVYKRSETIENNRPVPVADTCCSCCCAPPPVLAREITENRNATRTIQVNIEYAKYSNFQTISNFRTANENSRGAMYDGRNQQVASLSFYLLRNNTFQMEHFNAKKAEAEALCHLVFQLKGINNNTDAKNRFLDYPGPQQLVNLFTPQTTRLFGDFHREVPVQTHPLSAEPRAQNHNIQAIELVAI